MLRGYSAPGLRKEAIEMATLSVPGSVPCTIIHGIHDDVVNKDDVVSLCGRSPSSTLILVQDDHMLKKVKDLIISSNDWCTPKAKLSKTDSGREFLAQWNRFMLQHGHHCRGQEVRSQGHHTLRGALVGL